MGTSVKLTVNGVHFEQMIDLMETGGMVDINNELLRFASNIKTTLAVLASQGIAPTQATAPAPAAPAPQPSTVETWTSTHVRHDFQNNKHIYRIIGGRWTQFGAPIYEDSVQIADPILRTKIFQAQMGDTPFAHVCVISLKDGKPSRVESVS